MHDSVTMRGPSRRGALLLVVLSMLITFLLLGTLLVTLATRARTSASAYAAAMALSNDEHDIARELLDEALMQLVRGRPTAPATEESILGDKHGQRSAIRGVASVVSDPATGPIIEITFKPDAPAANGGDASSPITEINGYLDLNGRVLTFAPTPSQGGTVDSYRILRAEPGDNNDYRCMIANIRPQPDSVLPMASEVSVYVNHHEFHEEPHDSHADDLWLTRFNLNDGGMPVVSASVRPAFAVTGTATVDNDGDGVPDGEWQQGRIPSRILSNGRELQFEVSYLVHDLDSRLNVNGHGSAARLKPTGDLYTASDWEGGSIAPEDPGFGWGAADVDLSKLLSADAHAFGRIMGGDSDDRPYGSRPDGVIRRRPNLIAADGRFGRAVRPVPNASQTDADAGYDHAVYRANPTVDLAAMMKVFVDPGDPSTGIPPTLRYRGPVGYSPSTLDDPYKARLDPDGPRLNSYSGAGTSNTDNLFTLSELERVLRQFDTDATALPQRLAGLLGDQSQALRMLVTTDSWDTPVLTGTWASVTRGSDAAFNGLANGLTPAQLYEILSPDVAAGLRFDINRPFPLSDPNDASSAETSESKEAYCKHLYCLLLAILDGIDLADAAPDAERSPHEILAQWVVNVVDYRDADSTSTRFAYDTDLTDGWNPGADAVHGHEQISLLLAETYGWFTTGGQPTSGLAVQLYRPDDPTAVGQNGAIVQKPCDPALRGDNGHIDICKQSPSGDPIWRLRYSDDTGECYVRFDRVSAADLDTNQGYTINNTSFQDTVTSLEIPPDGFICIYPGQDESLYTFADDKPVPPNAFLKLKIDQGKKMGFVGATAGNGYLVHLERLADPSADFNSATNPYINLNEFIVKHEQKPTNGSDAKSVRRCPYHFWITPDSFCSFGGNFAPLPRHGRRFLVWPDRPFVSQAELAMVPPTAPGDLYSNAISPTETPYHYLSVLASELAEALDLGQQETAAISETLVKGLLDATYVPSRFVGSAINISNPAVNLQKVGMTDVPFRQVSRYREPGRVNLNTMPHTTFANNGLARAVISGSAATTVFASQNPFLSSPAKRWADLLRLNNASDGFYFDTETPGGGGNGQGNECNGNCGPNDAPNPTQSSLYPLLGIRTAIRLANVATVRSHVFAVWITLKTTDMASQRQSFHRLFAVVDRSIPAAYRKGENLNAYDTIRLKRFID